jgi:hypothetical protein
MTMWKKSWKTTYGKFVGKNGVEKIADKWLVGSGKCGQFSWKIVAYVVVAKLPFPQSGVPSHLCFLGIGDSKWSNDIPKVLILLQTEIQGILIDATIPPS